MAPVAMAAAQAYQQQDPETKSNFWKWGGPILILATVGGIVIAIIVTIKSLNILNPANMLGGIGGGGSSTGGGGVGGLLGGKLGGMLNPLGGLFGGQSNATQQQATAQQQSQQTQQAQQPAQNNTGRDIGNVVQAVLNPLSLFGIGKIF